MDFTVQVIVIPFIKIRPLETVVETWTVILNVEITYTFAIVQGQNTIASETKVVYAYSYSQDLELW